MSSNLPYTTLEIKVYEAKPGEPEWKTGQNQLERFVGLSNQLLNIECLLRREAEALDAHGEDSVEPGPHRLNIETIHLDGETVKTIYVDDVPRFRFVERAEAYIPRRRSAMI
jgi:hypothetical protein